MALDINRYLLQEYNEAGVEPDFMDFDELNVMIPCAYYLDNPKGYMQDFVEDFLDLDGESIATKVAEYEAHKTEPVTVYIDEIEVLAPYDLVKDSDDAFTLKNAVLTKAYHKYYEAVAKTDAYNKLYNDNLPVKVGQKDLATLNGHLTPRPKNVQSGLKSLISRKLSKVRQKVIEADFTQPKRAAQIALVTSLGLASYAHKSLGESRLKTPKISAEQAAKIKTAAAEHFAEEEYVADKSYKIQAYNEPSEKITPVPEEKTEKAVVTKNSEKPKFSALDKPLVLKPLAAKKPEFLTPKQIKVREDILRSANQVFGPEDPELLFTFEGMARSESSLRSDAKNKLSSGLGPLQNLNANWMENVRKRPKIYAKAFGMAEKDLKKIKLVETKTKKYYTTGNAALDKKILDKRKDSKLSGLVNAYAIHDYKTAYEKRYGKMKPDDYTQLYAIHHFGWSDYKLFRDNLNKNLSNNKRVKTILEYNPAFKKKKPKTGRDMINLAIDKIKHHTKAAKEFNEHIELVSNSDQNTHETVLSVAQLGKELA